MRGGERGIELHKFLDNSAWTVTNTSWNVFRDKIESTITFSITLKRKPMFFILSVILPVSMLALLNICVFVLPCDSGEKASYAMTVFLAFAVFLTIVSSTLPQNSEKIAVIAVFLIIQTASSTFITITALLMMRLKSYGDDKVLPRWFIKAVLVLKCHACQMKVNPKVSPVEASSEDVISLENTVVYETTDNSFNDSARDFTVKEVVDFLDFVFFVIYSIVLLLSVCICFTVATTAN